MFDWLRGKDKTEQIQIQEKNSEQDPYSKSAKEAKLETYLNELVICVSNEVSNFTVGYAKEICHITQAKIPMLVVYDIVNKREVMPMGRIYGYTEQLFNALNKLEPNERIAVLYEFDGEVNKTPRDGEIIYPPEVWAEKVKTAIADWQKENEPNKTKKIKP